MSAAYSHIISTVQIGRDIFQYKEGNGGHHSVVEREEGTINTSKTILRMGVAVAPGLAPSLVGH